MASHHVPTQGATTPNLVDYDAERSRFRWSEGRAALDGLPGDAGLNIAHEAVDRHVLAGRGDRVALRCLAKDSSTRDLTYLDLAERSSQWANALDALGVEAGESVFTLLGRVPELYIAVLGALKHRNVVSPLFSVFGPEPIRQRLQLGRGRVLVTTSKLYRRRIEEMRADLPALDHVVVIDDEPPEGTIGLAELLAAAATTYTIEPTDPEDLALLHFTSGTTGTPKGAMHVHGAVVAHLVTSAYALDLHPGDTYWCTADPGWVTGTSYGIIAPLVHGVTSIVDEGDFSAGRWYEILDREAVNVWYTAPTAIRMLMRAGGDEARQHDLSALRVVASVGEPLNPEAVTWGEANLGLPIHDNWWQTETGGIMIANYRTVPVRPGSMGRPMPGIDAALLERTPNGTIATDATGDPLLVEEPGREGELALRAGWPSMFRGYLGEPDRYAKCFVGDWYRSGDLARMDADGYFWFVGRADDVIKSSGHLIGPFEVESALIEHPAVFQAGVIGIPDEMAGELVKAFVALVPGYEPSEDLELELLGFARTRLGPAVAPRSIAFDQNLPITRSGKIMRRVLKARELGLPEGDLSTMEESSS